MATKLVRDRIREVPGFRPCSSDFYRPVENPREHEALLLKKVHEELGELIEALSDGYANDINDEGCDVIEAVMTLLAKTTDITAGEILTAISKKQRERGGYSGGLVWEHP